MIYCAIFMASVILTGIVRRYALATNQLDIPNHRSSHKLPTPRGGGLAFVLVFLISLFFIVPQSSLVYILPGIGVAALGFMDDKEGLSPFIRLLGHFAASILAIYLLKGVPSLNIGFWIFPSGLFLDTMAVIYLVWLLNLFNFMDGIDGLAAVQALFSCLALSFLYLLQFEWALIPETLLLASAVAGFLVWNFPPAKIFMGDVGSGFLGLMLGLLSLQSTKFDPSYLWGWLIVLGPFIVDATLTLGIRASNKKAFWQAHRSHAYQHATLYYGAHKTVVWLILLLNIGWLLPLAYITVVWKYNGLMMASIAYLPLIGLALWFKAGKN